ncbi:uncharacterized protein LOC131059760 isoform X2 [Cryptomeria japonica]|uniref:uncharacterized protein LOC131059760 isoform X2 n=1 Tax=Cryptomeria japonica TaxID=3369 RepID=UPI0027DA0258|nr:uncharacterized protein LOC131059760 isoform X2 [Cryptomeria japonica]
MAEKITKFLHYGASPAEVESVNPSTAHDFAPSLVLHALDNPSIAPHLLLPLVSNPRTPKVMSYASLDFDEVRESVALAEDNQEDDGNVEETGQINTDDSDEGSWEKDWGLLNRHCSEDECLKYEAADEIHRAKIAITSLRKCASDFSCIIESGSDAESWWIQQCKAEGGIWSSEIFFSDLLSMLPIAVSRCPDLLEPEILVKGLLTAKWGGVLLAAILINNPLLHQDSVILLAEFISKSLRKIEIDPSSSDMSFFIDNSVQCQVSKNASKYKLNRAVFHCIQQACWVFVLLCQSVPQFTFGCREALVKKCIFADMVMHTTLELLHDELDFLSRVIFSDKQTSEWMLLFISLGQKKHKSFLPSLTQASNISKDFKLYTGDMEDTIQHLRRVLLVDAEILFHEDGWRGQLHGHLRLYCVLICACDLQPTHEEVMFWLHALAGKTVTQSQLTSYQPKGVVAQRTLQLGIAFLCLFVRNAIGMDVSVNNSSLEDLCEAAVATGIISEATLVLKATAALRPLGPISNTKKNADLLLRCLYELMMSGNFIRYSVDISEVIVHCITLSAEPVHPMLVQLIQMFAEASSPHYNGEVSTQEFRMRPLPFSFLSAAIKHVSFCGRIMEKPKRRSLIDTDDFFPETKSALYKVDSELMVCAALSTFYILCREQALQSAGIFAGYAHGGSTQIHLEESEYIQWSKLLADLPLHTLLMYMEYHWLEYEHLLPQWLSLASHLFPERLIVSKLLELSVESDKETDLANKGIPVVEDLEWIGGYGTFLSSLDTNQDNKIYSNGSRPYFSIDIVCRIFRNALEQPLPVLQILKAIQVEAAENVFNVQSVVINDLVPLLLKDSCARPLQKCFCDWWKSLPHGELELLVPLLFNSLKITDIDKNNRLKELKLKTSMEKLDLSNNYISYAELAQEPLALLACKSKVFRTPLLSIFLDLLMELLVKNRRLRLAGVSQREKSGGSKHEEIVGALAVQESAMCQILLEACLQNPLHGDDIQPGPMLEARQLICAFISSLLDISPTLLKLLHLQGYDIQLIPMMMEGVLAMVQCFKFVQELLQRAQHSQQIFVIALIANLVCRYPNHHQSMEAAKQVVEHVKYLWSKANSTGAILKEVLEPMVWCAISFPSLALEVTALLQSCIKHACPLEQPDSVSDHALQDAAVAAFRLFVQKKVLPGRVFS